MIIESPLGAEVPNLKSQDGIREIFHFNHKCRELFRSACATLVSPKTHACKPPKNQINLPIRYPSNNSLA
jgi:hypothetical protein